MNRRRYKVHLVTFANGEYSGAQQRLTRSALELSGIDYAHAFTPKDIPTTFYATHRNILELPRGAGYWLWKPFFILEKLKAVADDDFVVYWDYLRLNLPMSVVCQHLPDCRPSPQQPAPAALARTLSGSAKVPGWKSWKTLVPVTAETNETS